MPIQSLQPASPALYLAPAEPPGILQTIRDKVVQAWGSVVSACVQFGHQIAGGFCHLVGWFNPLLGARLDAAYARACLMWQSIWQENQAEQIAALKVKLYGFQFDRRPEVLARLQALKTENELLTTGEAAQGALLGSRNILAAQNKTLETQNTQLQTELATAEESLTRALAQVQALQSKELEGVQQKLDFDLQAKYIEELRKQVALVTKAHQAEQSQPLQEALTGLLPLMLGQIEQAQHSLSSAKATVSENTPAHTAILSLERCLSALGTQLSEVPRTIKLCVALHNFPIQRIA